MAFLLVSIAGAPIDFVRSFRLVCRGLSSWVPNSAPATPIGWGFFYCKGIGNVAPISAWQEHGKL